MHQFVTPPRGSVKITRLDDGSFRVDCAACGWSAPQPPYKLIRTAADEAKRCHRCPVGEP